ncbi:hypothetical protein, partial [Pseudomonas aeruginosa]|uniref:hypothetical protein n=1 Tax=Pseudomonas aeruginosa TaxID=287 RepID=UPI002118EF3B
MAVSRHRDPGVAVHELIERPLCIGVYVTMDAEDDLVAHGTPLRKNLCFAIGVQHHHARRHQGNFLTGRAS